MPENPIKGYTSKQQPDDLDATVAGAGTSGNPEEFKDDAALRTVDSVDNDHANGDNPPFDMPPFANGKDLRVKG